MAGSGPLAHVGAPWLVQAHVGLGDDSGAVVMVRNSGTLASGIQPGVQAEERVAFGTLLRHFRAAAGLSQEALAERAGVSRRGIADLERGARRFPFGETVRRLADALGLAPVDRATLINSAHKESAGAYVVAPRLPSVLSSLVGRQHELVELRRLLPTTRILTLTGPGGIGKTRLGLELGRLVELEFADGAAFVDLAPVLEPVLVSQAVARGVGVREQANLSLIDTLQRHLGARQMLVIVDNCEHLLDAVARMVDLLARTCSRIKILATGREALHVRGEVAWMVRPLSVDDAARLFVERAWAAQSSSALGDDQTSRISEICEHLDGIPLAIELAAVRVPAISLDQIAARLEHRLRLLSSGNRLDAPRHQTLRAAIDWSYDLLSAAEQRLFERLAIFAGGWRLEAAEAVCAWEPIASLDVLGLLANLVATAGGTTLVPTKPRPFSSASANGVPAQCLVTQAAPSIVYELQIIGNTGTITLRGRNFLQFELEVASNSVAAYREPTVIRPAIRRDNVTMMLVPELEEFARSIREHRLPSITAADGRRVLRVLDAVVESGRTALPVSLKSPVLAY